MMGFRKTEEQRLLLGSVDRMMARHLPPEEVRRRDAETDPPDHLLPVMAEMGLLGLAAPQARGGQGSDWQTMSHVQERLGYHATMAAILFNRVTCFGIMTLLTSGSAAQSNAFLPRMLAGEGAFALALTEPGAGSDAGALATRARREGPGWRITGLKHWISGAASALRLVVAARTDTGISLFLVPPDAQGVALTPLDKIGNRCSLTYAVAFDDVAVPPDALLGPEGQGFGCLKKTLFYGRTGLAAAVVGTAQAAVDAAVAHARDRAQFGQPIGGFQALAHRLAIMQTEVDQARLLLRNLAWAIDEGEDCTRLAAQTKWAATEMLKRVTEEGMQIMASAGYAVDSDMQRYWRDSRLYTFGEGSSEIQLDLIARDMGLGRALAT